MVASVSALQAITNTFIYNVIFPHASSKESHWRLSLPVQPVWRSGNASHLYSFQGHAKTASSILAIGSFLACNLFFRIICMSHSHHQQGSLFLPASLQKDGIAMQVS